MPRGLKHCKSCDTLIGNAARRCRHCGHGEPSTSSRYARVYVPGHPMATSDGYALQHRWQLYEMAIPVPDGYHVHHRNGDRFDNRWSNLEVLPAGEHARHHIVRDDMVTNQYGTFPVIRDPEGRRERMRQWNAKQREYKVEWARRKRRAEREC